MSLDQFPIDAFRLVSHMQPLDPKPLSPLPSDDGNSSNGSRPASSQDPYYSNDDIAALHAVVVAAQEILDSAPEPKPLPAAVLFNAYDAILPNYGIDPDSDHHLSAFVFRIGGEGGNGSLVDKFQAILARMGIVLEFGDNTTESSRPSFSASSSPHVLFDRQEKDDQEPSPHPVDEVEIEQPQHPPLPPIVMPQTLNGGNYESWHGVEDEDEIRVRAQRAALSTILGRWRSQALERRQRAEQERIEEVTEEEIYARPSYQSQGHAVTNDREEPESGTRGEENGDQQENELGHQHREAPPITVETHQDSLRSLLDPPRLSDVNFQHLPADQPQRNNTPTASRPEETVIDGHDPANQDLIQGPVQETVHATYIETQELTSPQENIEAVTVPSLGEQEPTARVPESPDQDKDEARPCTPVRLPKDPDTVELEIRHGRLTRQAERARELYLASKVFNHWADRTARRLERDAVARRHMIRFRYFRAWTQAPVSREQTIDHMRATTVVKKWQRMRTQDDNIGCVAIEIAAAYRFKTIHRILDQWSCHRVQHVSRDNIASRYRNRALLNWISQSSADQAFSEAIEAQSKLERECNVLLKWRNHANRQAAQAYTSQRVAIIQQTFDHIRNWWDQTEIERRAEAYRRRLLVEKTCSAFDQWNLQARAQAFIWRREYISVTRLFNKWCQHVEQTKQIQREAHRCYEGRAKSGFWRHMSTHEAKSSLLAYLEKRSCLYIRGTLLLKVFDRGIKQRKDRDKQNVKRYLMARFTQASSARKKRNFFAALDKWTEFTAMDSMLAGQASDLKMRNQTQQQLAALQLWDEQMELDQTALNDARLQHGRGLLQVWKEHSAYLDGQDIEAWQLWASERQRNCLKEWSIASLQQSGQAHTASEVRKKHDRQKRNRHVQHWRQLNDRLKPDAAGAESLRASTVYRGSWRALSGRRSVIRRNDKVSDYPASAVETPTRWTGQPTAVSSILPASSMAPVREVDEDGASSTTAEDVGMVTSPSKKVQDRRANRFFLMSSTTPRAPVPLYLERGFQENDDEFVSDENEAIGRSRQQRLPSGSTRRRAMATQAEPVQPENHEPPPSLLRPPAPVKPFAPRTIGEGSLGVQSSHPSLSRTLANKSVGAKQSGLRYGISQSSRPISSARSVRIRSPKSFAITTPRPADGPR